MATRKFLTDLGLRQWSRCTRSSNTAPADDRAYLAWRDGFLADASQRDLASRWHDAADRPLRLEAYRLDDWLYRQLGGPNPLFGEQDRINYHHRLRFLAVALKTRRRETLAAARRYVNEASACHA